MKRRAIGLTAAPEYPEIEDLPFTTGIAVIFSISIFDNDSSNIKISGSDNIALINAILCF